MRRILYIHHCGATGGAPLSLLYLIQKLDRRRYEPIILFLEDGDAVSLFRQEGISTFVRPDIAHFDHVEGSWYNLLSYKAGRAFIEAARFPFAVARMRTLLAEHPVDLVHLNTTPQAACALAAHRAGIPVVWHIREILHDGHLGLRKWLFQRCIDRCAARVIAICQYGADRLLPSPRIHVIYNFVDFGKFRRDISGDVLRKEWNVEPGTRLVGMLGGVLAHKGTLEFVQALPLVKEKIKVKFLIAGMPPRPLSAHRGMAVLERVGWRWFHIGRFYDRAIVEFIHANHLDGDVIFTGIRHDMPQVIAALDLVAFPSTVPHFARPIIEAGAMARPVVASDLGGPQELVEHGVTGLLVQPRSPRRLADAIVKILSDPALAQRMGEAGYVRACRDYDADRNAAATFQLYDEILEG